MRRITVVAVLCFILNFVIGVNIALAREPENPQLTLQQAIDKALLNSKSIKSADYDIDRTEELRDKAADKVMYTPYDEATTAAETAFTGLQKADTNWQMAKRTYEAEQDSLVMKVIKAYNGLLQATENVKMAEAQLKYDNSQHIIALAKNRVGLLNKAELVESEATVETSKSDLEAKKKALDDSYEAFNLLVGLWPEDRPVLTDLPGYEELTVNNLDYEVQKAFEQSPTVWLAQKNVDLAKIAYNIWNYDSTSEPIKVVKIDLDKAKLDAADTNEQFKNLVRTIYYKTKQLEEQYAGCQESVKVAEEALRVIRVKYEVGMVTAADVTAAEIALEKAKKLEFDTLCEHDILTYAFQKPWAYAG
ncbi:TolC family protein [Pelotomaculum terephthalicicum JT]|uniref:TolC family protein n=1 Tax=Pelotomaculum terephthalicicum TaxID=206393 RepID=UPI001F044E20|nr:TolC family protein [Pelotomaculum terephthalicicum]MCG9967940.1 TolC family protein [Pelotomaculum terephthalicicum JT]